MSVAVARIDLRASACRFCGTPLSRTFVDLGATPPANSYLRTTDLRRTEAFLPLHAYVCESCFLVQLDEMQSPEQLFADYAYFSSYSDSWLAHANAFAESAVARFGLGPRSRVIEIASNDGYLLQYFVRRGVPVLGIEPAANVARVAEAKGVRTLVKFFGRNTARTLAADGVTADLIVANNVLAHVPNLNDFVGALKPVLNPSGVVSVEFPHLLRLIEGNQFDTIYHEHFSYFSLLTAEQIFAAHGFTVFDVEELATHGGSLRLFLGHTEAGRPVTPAVGSVRAAERAAKLDRPDGYDGFAERVRQAKRRLLSFLIEAKSEGKRVVGYGAAAKGNTLLNYCGVRTDFIDYTVDRSPHKQGLYLPGTRIPIRHPDRIRETRPDYLLILPWNLRDEIMAAHGYIRDWGGKFVVPIPHVSICP